MKQAGRKHARTGLAVMACSDSSPSSPEEFRSLASILGPSANNSSLAPPIVYNTQMRSELESPACATESKGHAHVKVNQDGTIDSDVTLNNKGGESVRFGHIHHLNQGAATGPIIWWLSSPLNTDLNLTDKHIVFHQQAVFVSNTSFRRRRAGGIAASPSEFYVNFTRCPEFCSRIPPDSLDSRIQIAWHSRGISRDATVSPHDVGR
jgi:hypothetical protein